MPALQGATGEHTDWPRLGYRVVGGGVRGRPKTGPSPGGRARPGSKHHLITEAHGIPLAVSLTGGNRNDVTQLMPLIEAIPPVRGRRGRPRQWPDALYADRGYDHDKYRRKVRDKGITPVIARRGTEHGSGVGTYRWVIEQSLALLHWFRRLRVRWEIRDDIHEAFLSLACAIICWRRLRNLSLC
jgi:transposase